MKKYILILSAGIALLALTGCNCDDVSYWEAGEGSPKLNGMVVTNGSVPLVGADVVATVGNAIHRTTTDIDGKYSFDEIEAGEALVTASYSANSDIKESSRTAQLKANTVTTCNFLLVEAATEYTKEKIGDDYVYSISLPDIVSEDKSVTQIATYYISDGTLDEGDELLLEAWYELDSNAGTKADGDWKYTDNDVIVRVVSSTRSGVTTAKKPFKVSIQQLINPTKAIHNGKSVEVQHGTNESYFYTTEVGSTELYYPVMVKSLGDGSEKLEFTPNMFNGPADYIEFSCKQKFGIGYEFKYTFLDQYVTLIEGGKLIEVETSFSEKVDIPSGEALVITGKQNYSKKTYKCEYAETSVVTWSSISYTLTDRQHTGGSN